MAYLVLYDLEKRLFFPLEWTGMGLGVKPRVWVPALLAGGLGTLGRFCSSDASSPHWGLAPSHAQLIGLLSASEKVLVK